MGSAPGVLHQTAYRLEIIMEKPRSPVPRKEPTGGHVQEEEGLDSQHIAHLEAQRQHVFDFTANSSVTKNGTETNQRLNQRVLTVMYNSTKLETATTT
jgi:hypothetical protein